MRNKVIVDCMGGDNAPGELVKGAVEAYREYEIQPILVGPRKELERWVWQCHADPGGIEIVDAPEVIEPGDPPVASLRRKPGSTLVVAVSLLKEGRGQALVSTGNTGALMAGGLLMLGRIPGIDRPGIGSFLPTLDGQGAMLIDMGAVVDAKPENLFQFAIMGSLYAGRVLHLDRPRVALLNVGTEEGKGNELTKRVYSMLLGTDINFVGNIEGRDVPFGKADVVICDGFVGNISLKLCEGMGQFFLELLKRELASSLRAKLGALILRPYLRRLVKLADYAEYGGAPLLGIEGIIIKCHGSANAKAIKYGIRTASDLAEWDLVAQISRSLEGRIQPKKGGQNDT